MLDINLFREEKGGNPEGVRESQRRRYASTELVDNVIVLDQEWRNKRYDLDQVNKAFNKLNKEIAMKRKAKEDATALQEESKALKKAIEAAAEAEKAAADARDKALGPVGNLVHDSVPIDNDEDNNKIEKTWGTPRTDAKYNHVDLVGLLGIVDLEAGQAVAGGRGYYLTNYGVLLNQALINYGLQFLATRGYCPVHTPFFMRKDIMGECAQLSDFDEQLYKVTGEGDEKYLIATSEQTISSMHRRKWYEAKDLPQRFAGYSTCFRKEAGSHGRDTLGIFRVHQFEKVEQFCITSPYDNESWKMMDEMLKNSEDFYQSLGIPYRVVNIVSGALNDAAAKKFDLEASFPASKTFRELVSCSNCTDYQSRRLEVRLRTSKGVIDQQKVYVHMLNSTLSATERTLCCILENYQTENGINVPEALQPFMMGVKFIPFVKQFDKKKNLVARAEPIFDELFGRKDDLFRVWFSPSISPGVKGSIEYLFKNLKLNKTIGDLGDENVPEDIRKYASSDIVMSFKDNILSQGVSILRFLASYQGSSLYPDNNQIRMKIESSLEWYNETSRGRAFTVDALTSTVLPQIEKWLSGSKYLAGKNITLADIVYASELISARKLKSDICKGFDLAAKWLKVVGDPKLWK